MALVTREDFDGIHWENISATAALLGSAEGKIGFRGKAASKALYGLDLDDDPDSSAAWERLAATGSQVLGRRFGSGLS